MIRNLGKIIFFVITLICFFDANAQNSLIISPIGPQEIIAGGSMPIFFSGVNGLSSGITYSGEDVPDFVTLEVEAENAGRFIVNSSSSDIGIYDFSLIANYNDQSAIIPIHLEVNPVLGQAYYCDPVNGSMTNNGDKDHPFSSLQDVFESTVGFEEGDVIFLKNGYHGNPLIKGYQTGKTYIVAQSNNNPKLSRCLFALSKNWVVIGLEISPEVIGQTSKKKLVNFSFGSDSNTIQNCEIYGIKNSAVWSTNQHWYDNSGDGIWCDGEATLIKNNYIYNTNFAVHVNKENSKFLYNTIDRYAGDAIRGLANNTEYSYNVIKNPVVDDYETGNHDDAFQSWTTPYGLPKKGIKIIGNQVFSATHTGIPLITRVMQGIINFDGFSEDWVIANNLVVLDHQHGITLVGAKNCKIVNNTVVKNPLNIHGFGNPWIGIWPTKPIAGSVPSTGNLVRNNIMPSYTDASPDKPQGVNVPGDIDHNLISHSYNSIYKDYNNWDFRLLETSSAIDGGSIEDATYIDMDMNRRNDDAIDMGCYEKYSNIKDIERPSPVYNIEVKNIGITSIELDWDDSFDVNGVAYYDIKYGFKSHILSNESRVLISGLRANTNYLFTINAVDYFGNTSILIESIELKTRENEEFTEVFFIPAHRYDQIIREDKKLMWVGEQRLSIGGVYYGDDAAAVIPFKLPRLRNEKKVLSALMYLHLKTTHGEPNPLDLYGLSYRSKPDVLASDYWQGAYDNDPNNTALLESYVDNNTNIGDILPHTTDNIGEYVQSLYDNGAKTNDYMFLRLNSNIDNELNGAYYDITSHDSYNTFGGPLLKIVTYDPSSVKQVEINNGLTVFPNPTVGSVTQILIQGFNPGEEARLYIHDALGKSVGKQKLIIKSKKEIVELKNILTQNGAYFITIIGKYHFAQTTMEVIK